MLAVRRRAPARHHLLCLRRCSYSRQIPEGAAERGSLDFVRVKGLKPLGYPSEGAIRQGSANVSHKDFCFLPLLQIAHDYVLCEDIFG
ncbi:hypothetical protein ARTHRO8AJ_460002 [Arthrobacter sp. 8AJ]|nr:hypothetical protein ARTHRO8AJ_460002 [Arthrobacter sp. 8AJ]